MGNSYSSQYKLCNFEKVQQIIKNNESNQILINTLPENKKWIMEVRDLWPNSIVAVGSISSKSLDLKLRLLYVTLRSRTNLPKPAGSSDAAWSVPFQVRSLVKWRSIHEAPRV